MATVIGIFENQFKKIDLTIVKLNTIKKIYALFDTVQACYEAWKKIKIKLFSNK